MTGTWHRQFKFSSSLAIVLISFLLLPYYSVFAQDIWGISVSPQDQTNNESFLGPVHDRMHMGHLSAKNSTADTNTAADTFVYKHPQVPLEVEKYPIAPDGLVLEQVHVYVRHGERTPVGVRLSGPPGNIPEYWDMCKSARKFRTAVSNTIGADISQIKVVERQDGTVRLGDCLLGELTDIGRQSTFNYGRDLRKLYIDRLGFLPDSLEKSDTVYFRSTNMPRTVESLQQIIHGLYPSDKCNPNSVPPILIRNGKDENLIGNTYSCKRLEILQIGFAKAAADAYNRTLEHLDKKLSKYLDGNPIRVDGKPRASGVLDTIRSALAHGIKVPPEFEDKSVVDVIERAVVTEWFSDKTEEVRRLGMGRLLGDLSDKMYRKAEQGPRDPLKILVHSTHDTAIAALSSTFDVYDEKWPAFTSSITFELFKKELPKSESQTALTLFKGKPITQHYVRMRFQNKSMALPICEGDGDHLEDHPEFCTLNAFRNRVKELIPTDWNTECSPAGKP